MAESLQQLLVTNFGLSPSGYAGSRGDVGYVGSSGVNGYTGSVGPAGAGASVPKITAIAYSGDDTATNPAGGDTITITGSGFQAGATVVVNGTQAGVVSVVSSTTITFTAPPNSAGSYIVYVVNTDGSTALAVPGIQYSGTPTWTTAAGTLGTVNKQTSFTANLTATGDAPITYSIYSGTLPAGLTLAANTGVISGTTPDVASSTTYNFTVRSTDAQQQDTDRAFNIIVAPAPLKYLWGWGVGTTGRLGLGDTTARSSPTQVGNLTNWLSVSAGYSGGLAIKADGTMWSWGEGEFGKLGLGDTVNISSPVQIGALTTWSTILAGRSHNIARKTDGTLWSWGRNSYGQLGLGNTTHVSSPVQIGALTTWLTISAGRNQQSMAIG